MLAEVEQSRRTISRSAPPQRKSKLGQFFTPASIAEFMAGLFVPGGQKDCRLLDPGAGIGSLTAAFLDRWAARKFDFKRLELHAFEIDENLHPHLKKAIKSYEGHLNIEHKIWSIDFITAATDWIENNFFAEPLPEFTHAILNPPYKKIRNNSEHRQALRRAGIETVNLYSAFLALSLALLDDKGQLVAIIPRSFCNGLYYRPFRNYILSKAAIRRLHLFNSRNKAFKDDDVLQENIIIHLERNGAQGPVIVSSSNDDSFSDLSAQEYPFDRIVYRDDQQQFIHMPTSLENNIIEQNSRICFSLDALGISVSTGPVVDFRVKSHLRETSEEDTVPLLYPAHFSSNGTQWPKTGKKPNAIVRNNKTEKWLYPMGFYAVVRRFSSKEEKRRVIANTVKPSDFGNAPVVGFENHLNVFHHNKQGLPATLAHGLTVFLNTTAVDEFFRRFNGHTQVNATDLRSLKYPSTEMLCEMGKWALARDEITQELIDEYFLTLIS